MVSCRTISGTGGERVVEQASVRIRVPKSHKLLPALEAIEFNKKNPF